MYIDLPSSIPTDPRIPPQTYLPTYLPTYPHGGLFLQIYYLATNLHKQPLAQPPNRSAKYYTTFPKYFPDGCLVVYRLLFAFFLVNSELLRAFRSFSVPFRSFSVLFDPFSVLFGPFRSFSVLFGPFRSFLILFGPLLIYPTN